MNNQSVCGSWTLSSFNIETGEEVKPWGRDAHGLLIYTSDGQMSVSINKAVEQDPERSETENQLDSILFYSGCYRVEGDQILHQVSNASSPSRIGKEMLRHVSWRGPNELELSTPQESFGRAVLVWKRM